MFTINHNTEVSHVYTLPVDDEVAAQLAESIEGKLPGGTFKLSSPQPGKMRLSITITKTEIKPKPDLDNYEEP